MSVSLMSQPSRLSSVDGCLAGKSGSGVQRQADGAELLLPLLAVRLQMTPPRSPWQTRRARRCRNSWRLSWVRMRRRFSLLSM